VQILSSSSGNFLTHVHVGREFDKSGTVPRLGADVPRWYGETISGVWWNPDQHIDLMPLVGLLRACSESFAWS
jgi:hypothetical protein